MPVEGLLALVKAESDLAPFAERWGRHDCELVRQAIAQQDHERLEAVIADAWPDISFGLSQMTVRTAGGYGVGDGSGSGENVLAVRAALFDRWASVDVGARHFKGCLAVAEGQSWDGAPDTWGGDPLLGALVVYNAGWLPPSGHPWWQSWAGNVRRYRDALEWARSIVEGGK